jgi:Gram-negative bacterial TonB protein C-terminal
VVYSEKAILLYWSSRHIASLPRWVFITTFLFAPAIADGLDSAKNKPPSLVTDPLIRTTPELLKHGLWGSSSVEIGIDSTGSVDSCIVAPSGNHGFDSLVKRNVAAARFTPAIGNGRAVPSTVRFEIAVPYDSLVSQCLRLPPNFVGTVIDTFRRKSLPETRIFVHYTDTTEDSALAIGFNRYLAAIGNRAGQKYDGTLIVAVTDSLGRFAFRLLPRGHFTVSVQSAGYEIGHFRGSISGDGQQECRYILRSLEERSHDSAYVITVYGRQTFADKKIDIAEEEKHVGFSPLLSNVVQAKAEIRRVPEGPSMMLVRSGCPYDNVYVVAGVPMLAPFHFGGYPYADIDGLMISALSNVNVTINDIAAKRVDASECIVAADPGRITYDNDSAVKGFYLKGDFSMLGVDLLAAYSAKKKAGDYVQVGYSACDNYMLKFDTSFYPSVKMGNQGIGIPLNYGNATLAASKSVGPLRCTAFGWLAWDSYNMLKATTNQGIRDSLVYYGLAGKAVLPWGMGSIKFTNDSSNMSFTIGGSHQFFGTGKQIISTVVSTRAFLNNGEITADFDTIIRTPFVAKLTAHVGYDQWNGYLIQQENNQTDTMYRAQGTETGLHLNTSLIKQTGRFTTELDLLASAIKYTGIIQLIGDAGASVTYEGDNFHTGIHFGRVTSRPDVRGLPDSLFRMQLDRTYIASLPLFFRYGMVTKFGVEPYIRYSTNAPQLDPVTQVWNPHGATRVSAYGSDFDCRIVPMWWAEFTAALNLADARRLNTAGNSLPYEWNLPWTIRANLHFHSKSDRFHLYVDYIRSKGLPYYDLDSGAYATLPVYRSLDLNFQIRSILPPQFRNLFHLNLYINKLDCYITLKNVQDLLEISNVRDYYWDSKGNRQPVYLGFGRVDIGARFGIKW